MTAIQTLMISIKVQTVDKVLRTVLKLYEFLPVPLTRSGIYTMVGSSAISGDDALLSHLLTAWEETPRSSARALCNMQWRSYLSKIRDL